MAFPCSGCKVECVSEMAGTYLLVFFGPASVIVAPLIGFQFSLEALVFVALVFGGTVASVILLLGKHSGAHINPAVSLANLFSGRFEKRLFPAYVLFQVAGGLLAGFSLWIVFGSLSSPTFLGSTRLAPGITPLEGVLLEAAGTFILALSALSASSFVRASVRQAALVGGTLFLLILFIGPLTGASFNPSRTLGPSLFSGYFSNQLVYWVGPLLGGACAGLLFGALRKTHGRSRRLPTVCMC